MGTSSSYGGNKDNKHLLPDDYIDDNPDVIVVPDVSWQGLKTGMSKHINGTSGSGGIKRISSQYVKASGGAAALLSKSNNGIRSTVNLGNIISGIRHEGSIQTFQKLGIECVGKSVKEIFSKLVNNIAEKSDTKDDSVAKEATIEALGKMYEFVEENGMEIEALDSMPEKLIGQVLCTFVGSYIWGKILNDLEICFEKHADNPMEAIRIEKDMKTYIENIVSVEFNKSELKNTLLTSNSINSCVEKLYQKCFEVLEVI